MVGGLSEPVVALLVAPFAYAIGATVAGIVRMPSDARQALEVVAWRGKREQSKIRAEGGAASRMPGTRLRLSDGWATIPTRDRAFASV